MACKRRRIRSESDTDSPADSWARARRHYRHLSREPDRRHLAEMLLVIDHAHRRGLDEHYFAYTLPDFLAISPARSPEEALHTPFLSVAVDTVQVFDLTLVAPAVGRVVSCRVPVSQLLHELDTSLTSLGELLVDHAQDDEPHRHG